MPKNVALNKNSPILITGANGFIGKNLTAQLQNLGFENLMLFDVNNSDADLEAYCQKAELVYHLAGVNSPTDVKDFYDGNENLTKKVTEYLKKTKRSTALAVTSSIQAELDNDYGKSKASAEQAIFDYGKSEDAPVFVFRLVGVFGKWCRPNYNSVVATFCHNIANNLPIQINDKEKALPLVYIDDVVGTLCEIANGNLSGSDDFMSVQPEYTPTLGKISDLLLSFYESRDNFYAPKLDEDFEKKLYATYTSYLPSNYAYELKNNVDNRGHLAEFLKKDGFGQMFVSTTKPGITRGNHWHNTKTEKFFVVSGEAVVRIRGINDDAVHEFTVNGEVPTVVDIPTGCTHNIENIGTGDLVTIFWSSEVFDPENPDTYYLEV